jgi:lysophospholipase L1-like esterase
MAAKKRIKNLTDEAIPSVADRIAIDGASTRSATLGNVFATAPTITALQSLTASILAAQQGGMLLYTTVAALNADLAHAARTAAMVQGDPGGDAVDGYYVKIGASGAGSWSRTGALISASFATVVAEIATIETRLAAETRINVPRVVYIGDSIFAFNHLGTPPPTVASSLGEIEAAHNFQPRFNIDTWRDDSTLRKFQGANQGVSADTTALVLARLSSAGVQAPDIVIVAVGINDVLTSVSAATIIANRKTITDYFTSRGAMVIDFAIRPVSTAHIANGSPLLTVITTVNTALSTYAATKPNNVFFDAHFVYEDPANLGRPKAGYTVDGEHPSTLGAWNCGAVLSGILIQLIKPHRDLPAFKVGNLVPNPTFTGTGGTLGARTTGTVATGYQVGMIDGTAVSVVSGLFFNAEGDGSYYHKLIFTPGGAAAVEHCIFQTSAGSVAVALDGKWVRLFAEIELTSWVSGWRSFQLAVSGLGLANQPYDETLDTYPAGALVFTLKTPPFKIPPATAAISPFLEIGIIGGATGTGTVKIIRWWMGEVPDPAPPRNLPVT